MRQLTEDGLRLIRRFEGFAALPYRCPAGYLTVGYGHLVKNPQAFQQPITNIPGKSLIALVVDYAPGGASPSHVHAKSAFILGYVLSGEIESQVNDGPKRVYRAGESFYEAPGSRHPISRNASRTQPAKLLAVFVVDTDDKELTTPVQ